MENNEFLTIPIFEGSPVRIRASDWPVIGRGVSGNRLGSDRCRATAVIVRSHKDGRTVVEAAYVCDGEDDIVTGKFGDSQREHVFNKDFVAYQVCVVKDYLNIVVGGKDPTIERAFEKALASLSPIDLT